MKIRCLLFFNLLLFAGSPVLAQSGKIPPFSITLADGKIFRAQDLPVGKPIIIIYFSPDCDHCDTLMKGFFGQPALFAKASVAMITYLPVDKVAAFVKKYGIRKYANIYAGTEGYSFFVRNYYGLTELPFAALYDRDGNFIQSYSKHIPLKELAGKLKILK
jgi:thiol-disulfide isomerase/thioredoxin